MGRDHYARQLLNKPFAIHRCFTVSAPGDLVLVGLQLSGNRCKDLQAVQCHDAKHERKLCHDSKHQVGHGERFKSALANLSLAGASVFPGGVDATKRAGCTPAKTARRVGSVAQGKYLDWVGRSRIAQVVLRAPRPWHPYPWLIIHELEFLATNWGRPSRLAARWVRCVPGLVSIDHAVVHVS